MEWVVSIVTVLGTIFSVAGVGLFVFNGTKGLIREMSETTKGLKEVSREQTELLKKMDEHLIKMDEHLVKVDEHLAKMDEHLIKMDEHLVKMDEHLVKMDERLHQEAQQFRELILEESRVNKQLLDKISERLSLKNT